MLTLYLIIYITTLVASFLLATSYQRTYTLKDFILGACFSTLGPFALLVFILVCWEDISKSLDKVVLYKRKVK